MKLEALLVTTCMVALPLHADAQAQKQRRQTKAKKAKPTAAMAEARQMLGVVPTFIKQLPNKASDALWKDFKGLWLTQTSIPAKYKTLIALGVASQIPCDNCVYFDTMFAKRLWDASDREVKESVLMASITRKASTVLNGAQPDSTAFQQGVTRMLQHMQKTQNRGATAEPAEVNDANEAYRQAKQMLGEVPSFIRDYPESAVAGFWTMVRDLQLSSNTAIPPKYKELIGLAVASQIPCDYCVYFHKKVASAHGATEDQIEEAIAIGGDARQWSTIMSGVQVDDRQFRREVRTMVKHLQKRRAERPRKARRTTRK